MRTLLLACLLLCLGHSSARAHDNARPYVPISRSDKLHILGRGALGIGGGVLAALVVGGLAWAFSQPPDCSEEDAPTCFDELRGPVVGIGVGATVLAASAPFIAGSWMASAGSERGRAGRRGATIGVAYAALLASATLSTLIAVGLSEQPASVLAPVASVLALGTLAAPVGLGYLVYRHTDRKDFERRVPPSALLAPAIQRGYLGLLFGARW